MNAHPHPTGGHRRGGRQPRDAPLSSPSRARQVSGAPSPAASGARLSRARLLGPSGSRKAKFHSRPRRGCSGAARFSEGPAVRSEPLRSLPAGPGASPGTPTGAGAGPVTRAGNKSRGRAGETGLAWVRGIGVGSGSRGRPAPRFPERAPGPEAPEARRGPRAWLGLPRAHLEASRARFAPTRCSGLRSRARGRGRERPRPDREGGNSAF